MSWTIPDVPSGVPLEADPTDLYVAATPEWQELESKNELLTCGFWLDAGQRAVKTFAQTLIALWGAGQFDVLNTPIVPQLGIAAGAAVLSLLQSVGGAR